MITPRPVTREDGLAFAHLEVEPGLAGLVAAPVWPLADSRFQPTSQRRVFPECAVPVGCCLDGIDDDGPASGTDWLSPDMLDRHHQGRGLGGAALLRALEETWAGRASSIRAMHTRANTSAVRLDAGVGFREIGLLDDGGLELGLLPPAAEASR